MQKWRISLIVVALIALGLFGIRTFKQEPLYHTQSYIFGTLVDISIYGEPEDRAKLLANQVLQDFQNLHNQLHAWKPASKHQSSELGALNTAFADGIKPIAISPQLATMLTDATELSVKSQGLFNPAIGHLVSNWGFQRDEFSAVNIDDSKIKALIKADPRMTDIVIKDHTAYSTNPNVKLDLGGYAKGYALDMAADYLRKQQVKNALVNIGGNIIALGQHGDKPWRVGIQHPRKPAAIATLALADGWAIGTSGDYQRYFMLDGKRYCHIIDPRSGYPVQHTQAVTVLIPPQKNPGVLSDVASKPIFIAAAEDKAKTAAMLGIQYFMVIDQQSSIFVSRALAHKLEWLDPEVKKNSHVKLVTLP
jgi:thiamine biosynthesis lipoprotein